MSVAAVGVVRVYYKADNCYLYLQGAAGLSQAELLQAAATKAGENVEHVFLAFAEGGNMVLHRPELALVVALTVLRLQALHKTATTLAELSKKPSREELIAVLAFALALYEAKTTSKLQDRTERQQQQRAREMVQFGLKLQDNIVAKWADHYLDYKKLKVVLSKKSKAWEAGVLAAAKAKAKLLRKGALSRLSSPAGPSPKKLGTAGDGKAFFNEANLPFESLVLSEVDKVERFYCRTVDRLAKELDALLLGEQAAQEGDGDRGGVEASTTVVEVDYQQAMSDIYRDLTLLRNFAILNYTGCVKILKKHDKKLAPSTKDAKPKPSSTGGVSSVPKTKQKRPGKDAAILAAAPKPCRPISEEVLAHVHKQDFYSCARLDDVMRACEREFALLFCGGDLAQARGMLLPQKLDEAIDWGQFQLGYHLGIAAILAFWVVWDCCVEVAKKGEDVSVMGQPAFRVFRAVAGLLLLHWAWAFSVLYWTRTRINFLYLFELDPRHQSPPLALFNDVAGETVVFLACLLAYYKAQVGALDHFIPGGYYPLALCLYVFKKLFLPLSVKLEVDFFATYCADVLTSSVKTLLDWAWTLMFFASGDFLLSRKKWVVRPPRHIWEHSFWYGSVLVPALCILPLWLRFQQCLKRYHDTGKRFPNLANALNSLYSFWWDVRQDWGLGHRQFGYLSDRRMQSRRWAYYATIAVDLVLRFNWLYSFIPPGKSHFFILPNYVTTLVIILEIFRRTLWGFFRLENEHLRNTEGYRSIDVVPLHFTTTKKADLSKVKVKRQGKALTPS
ncbi:EXS family-domain-containing protein [Tribonema minus]|uniref:EXS family-domain-containing protein n=1 Tax=Tribonema minus TaxID=303371 RepID=A0A835YP28_9STRA|nr:EXS family-domain-containing protein [Tribonema minus]